MTDDEEDVPIRIDHRDLMTARSWIEETQIKRPFRPNFFAAFCSALSSRPQIRILELGSGPGQLAREILIHCDVSAYVALDWSQAMHDIAAEHLADLARRVTFVVRDFREPTWSANLGTFGTGRGPIGGIGRGDGVSSTLTKLSMRHTRSVPGSSMSTVAIWGAITMIRGFIRVRACVHDIQTASRCSSRTSGVRRGDSTLVRRVLRRGSSLERDRRCPASTPHVRGHRVGDCRVLRLRVVCQQPMLAGIR